MIVVTAPTSTIGRDLVTRLLDTDTDTDTDATAAATAGLRLVVRDPDRLDPDLTARAGVEVIVGSHGDADVIDAACDGADAVFWLAPADSGAVSAQAAFVDFTRPAVAAFARHGVRRVVGVSALGRGTVAAKDAGMVTASLAMDDLIAGSGVAYRAVVCPSFMHNLLRQVRLLAKGEFSGMGRADLAAPLVASADIAAAAAALLLDDSWAGGGFAEVPVLGPQDLTKHEMARILGEVLERDVTYREVSAQEFAAGVAGFGTSPGMVEATVAMFRAKNEGMDNAVARTAATATPTTFRQWCADVLKPAMQG